jgi:hypothetical protein
MSQEDAIYLALLDGEHITALDALEMFHCFRLAARIYDLRQRGIDIETAEVETKDGKTIALYYIPQKKLSKWRKYAEQHAAA